MAKSVTPDDVNAFLDNTAWAICSTYHTVLKTSPSAAILDKTCSSTFLVADWHKIGEYRQLLTDCSNQARALDALTMITRSEIKY
jgi:hypothetical protein